MRVLVALCVLTFVAMAYSKPHSRGCIYGPWGMCMKQCEEGTSSYSTGCGPMTPEATCDNPNPVAGKGAICDYSACYCDSPTVRDSVSGKCVPLDECPPKNEKPIDTNEKPVDKNETPVDKNEKPIDKNEKPVEKS